jgi:hypothetical protein
MGEFPTETCVRFWPLCHLWAALVFGRCRDPVILDHGAPIREVGNVGNRGQCTLNPGPRYPGTPAQRGPGIQGPHHRDGRESTGGLDPCRPALVRPVPGSFWGSPNGPLSSVKIGRGDHGDIPDHRSPEDQIRILGNRILKGPGNRGILVIPALTLSGGVPGADENRNPVIGGSQLDQGTLVSHPLPVGRYWLFGSTVRTWITSPIRIYDC